MVLARGGVGSAVLHHRDGGYRFLARPLVVWPCMPSGKHVSTSVVEVFTSSADTPLCPNNRFSSVCRDCCLHLLWNWNLQYLGRLLGHGRCVLADDTHNHSHWHRALLRLCTDDVVQLLSYRVSCGMGSSKERAPAERVYSCLHRRWVRRQVPDMRPCLSDATDSLQKP